jgi:hypothetical protein
MPACISSCGVTACRHRIVIGTTLEATVVSGRQIIIDLWAPGGKMHRHISFQPVQSQPGAWILIATWDHVLRERILGVEFASENQALRWISECADEWIAGRKPADLQAMQPDAPPAEGGRSGSTADASREEQLISINLAARRSNRPLYDAMTSDAQVEVHLEAPGTASAAMLRSPGVAPNRLTQLTGVIFTYRRERPRP